MPTLVEKILDTCRAACSDATLNSAQLKTVLKLANEALRLTQRTSPEIVASAWKADAWTFLKTELIECERFENAIGLHQTCDQIAKAIQAPDSNSNPNSNSKTQAKKRKITDAQPAPEKRETKRKKVKGGA